MIHLKGIAKAFGSHVVLRSVTYDFERGTISLLTGGNGAGKSTLLKIIGGLVRPTGGHLVNDEPDAIVGYLGHATFIYPGLTALENLRFWQKASGLPHETNLLTDMLGHVGLGASANIRAGVFSRGMKQRLSLARILLLKPDLLLLDEPGTGLDVASREMLEQEIAATKECNACVIWVSHDASHDAAFADRILAIRNRKLIDLTEEGETTC